MLFLYLGCCRRGSSKALLRFQGQKGKRDNTLQVRHPVIAPIGVADSMLLPVALHALAGWTGGTFLHIYGVLLSIVEFAVSSIGAGAVAYLLLKSKITTLERRIHQLERSLSSSIAAERTAQSASPAPAEPLAMPTAAAPEMARAPHPSFPPRPLAPLAEPPEPSALTQAAGSLLALAKRNPFASLGVILMLVGVGFLFSLMAASNILPPELRIGLIAAAGVAMFGLGVRQDQVRPSLAMNLQGGGLAIEFLTVLWAYQGYGLISAPAAFAALALLASAGFVWAALKKRGLFALMALAGALLTPVAASSGQGTFAGLTLYCLGVTVLALLVAGYLRMPSLSSAALAGVSLLLGTALNVAPGDTALSTAGLMLLWISHGASGLLFARSRQTWPPRQHAAIASVLLGAPLVISGFLYFKADVFASACAWLLALSACAYAAAGWRSPEAMRSWLLGIAAGLWLIAVGIGLEGPNRAMAYVASAFGIVMLGRAVQDRRAEISAALYWALSACLALAEAPAHIVPLVLAGGVALTAGYFTKESMLRHLYLLAAPMLLYSATPQPHIHDPRVMVFWFIGWTLLAMWCARLLRWPALRLSALWLLPAGAVLLWTSLPYGVADIVKREALLLAWLLISTALAYQLARDKAIPLTLPAAAPGLMTLLLPALVTIEFLNWEHRLPNTIMWAAIALVWSGWTALSASLPLLRQLAPPIQLTACIAGVLLALNILIARPGMAFETLHWASLALVGFPIRADVTLRRSLLTAMLTLAGAVVLGALLRAIGHFIAPDQNVLALLFVRGMQPWISGLWAAAAIGIVAFAATRGNRPLWTAGALGIALLLAKMLLVDLATFTLIAKVVVFLATGAALVGLGFFCPLPPESRQRKPEMG
jgi:hypothetical protein